MTRVEQIRQLLDVAEAYLEDGAWHTAADRFMRAARLIQDGANEFDRAMARASRAVATEAKP